MCFDFLELYVKNRCFSFVTQELEYGKIVRKYIPFFPVLL